jgi:hypothetical protein
METTMETSQVEGLASEDTTAQPGAAWPEGDPAGAPSHLFAAARAHLDCADMAMAEARGFPGLGALLVVVEHQQAALRALTAL